MGIGVIASAALLPIFFLGVFLHPERSPIMDPTQARHLFAAVVANHTQPGDNSTTSGFDVAHIFSVFDLNGDNRVEKAEFTDIWLSLDMGDEESATYLFNRADTDKDGSITEYPDLQRIYHYFDIDGNGDVNEAEFTIIWSSLSS